MQNLGYYNGVFAPMEELTIPALDRAVYFGDGVYEYLYCKNGKPFGMREHIRRLFSSMELMKITPPMSASDIEEVIYDGLSRVEGNEKNESGVYFQVSRGTYPRKHSFPPADIKANFLMFITPTGLKDISKPFKMCTMEDIRWAYCNIKSLNLITNALAAQYAVDNDCNETIFHRNGVVTENATSNLFIWKNNVLKTAPLSNLLLAGVTREHMIELAKGLGLDVVEEAFTLEDMFAADEIIVASTTTHGASIGEIDGKKVGGKAPELVKKLQEAYANKVAIETA